MAIRKKKKVSGAPRVKAPKSGGMVTHIIPPRMPKPVPKVVDPNRMKLAPTPKFKVKLSHISAPASEAHMIGTEPEWSIQQDELGKTALMGRALGWYNATMGEKHRRKFLGEWIRGFKEPDVAAKIIRALDRVPDKAIGGTFPTVARLQMKGYNLSLYHYDQLRAWFNDLIKNKTRAALRDERSVEPKELVSVQDRITNQVRPVLAEIDALTDAMLDGDSYSLNDVKTLLHNPEFKPPHYRVVCDHVEEYLREWNDAMLAKKSQSDDEDVNQLAEGYGLTTVRQLKTAITMLAAFNSEIKGTIEATKTPRKRRARSPEKVVSKVKYLAEFEEFKLTSVQPKELLGASIVWIYDTKRRKLGQYISEFAGSIDVKGTTLLGVDAKLSTCKTLRRPEDQLAEFEATRGKAAIGKWYERIRAKAQVLRPRLNTNVVILRVD